MSVLKPRLRSQRKVPRKNIVDVLPDMGDSAEKWLHDLFKAKGCYEVKTITKNEKGGRSLVAVYKNPNRN